MAMGNQIRCRRTMLAALLCIFLSLPVISGTQDQLRHFVSGSYSDIVLRYQNSSFILVFWSIDCPPCYEELTMLGGLYKQYPVLPVVLVSTDGLDVRTEVEVLISEKGLTGLESWIFTDSLSERLRFEVDKYWYGELPRSYFFSKNQPRHAVSGRLSHAYLMKWLNENNMLHR
ncbi:MAG: TlpA family protein disulfide reductase [Gammaproteobacteria bacterium]|nr:TlpA family protein disulfide reductase [Gammaproteobacteria bacterium]